MILRVIAALLVSAGAMGAAHAAASGRAPLQGGCDADGSCTAVFADDDVAARRLCGRAAAAVAWQKGRPPYIAQCIDDSAAEENINYIITRVEPGATRWMAPRLKAIMLDYGRLVDKHYLADHPTGPAPLALHGRAFCAPVNVGKLGASDFALLERRPANGAHAYCDEVTYVAVHDGAVAISTATADVKPGDAAYYGPAVSLSARADLGKMLRALRSIDR